MNNYNLFLFIFITIKGSTTDYDTQRNHQPWKDSNPLNLKKEKNNFRKKTIASTSKSPTSILWTSTDRPVWVPTMRQPIKKQKKIKVKSSDNRNRTSISQVEDFSPNIIYIDGLPYIKLVESQQQDLSVHNDEFKESIKNSDTMKLKFLEDTKVVPPPVAAPLAAPKSQWYDKVHPLAVFDAYWLSREGQEVSTEGIYVHAFVY